MTRHETKQALNSLLETIGARGLSGVSVRADSLLEALVQLDAFEEGQSLSERRNLTANLRRQGLVEVSRRSGKLVIQPSVKGVHRLQRAQLSALFVQPQQRWDGTWRM